MTEALLTPGDVARLLRLSRSKVYDLMARRQLAHVKIGKCVRVRTADLEAYIKECQVSVR
jgi:excisionase family DNA binding protein